LRFNFENYRDLEIQDKGHSGSSKPTQTDPSPMISFNLHISMRVSGVILALSNMTLPQCNKSHHCTLQQSIFVITGRMPQSGKLPVLNLLTGQKSGFFCPAGATRCTDLRQTWQGRRAHGSAWLWIISPRSPQGRRNAAPK